MKMMVSLMEIGMSKGVGDEAAQAEALSASVDGEAGPEELAAARARWGRDAEFRATWHCYHLIGDVLRSDDLASNAAHDSDFLLALRNRLAAEPVVLAPVPSPTRRRIRRWAAPAAVAVAAVAVSGWMLRPTAPANPGIAVLAPAAAPALASAAVNTLPSAVPPEVARAAGALTASHMLRDPQLDGYFAAHKQFSGGSAVGMPSGFVRNATVEVPAR